LAASSRRALALAWGLTTASTALAQTPAEVLGRVARLAGADTLALAGAEVVLHRIGTREQGPVDSLLADRAGRFRFRFTIDSAAIYLLSVRHHGISYFSSPVAREPGTRTDDILLIVSDTSSAAPVSLAARSLVVGAAEPSGARLVVEVIELANRGQRTRVAPDSVPTAALALARGGSAFQVQDTDLSPDAVQVRGDSLLIFAPLAPGARMVILQYSIAAGVRRLELPPGPAVDTLQILLDPRGLALRGDLPAAGQQIIDGRPYDRWIGAWPAGTPLAIEVTGLVVGQGTALAALVAALALALGAGLLFLTRRRRAPPAGGPLASPRRRAPELLEALGRLDAAYQGRQADTPPDQWHRYQAERARLKAEFEAALASEGRRP